MSSPKDLTTKPRVQLLVGAPNIKDALRAGFEAKEARGDSIPFGWQICDVSQDTTAMTAADLHVVFMDREHLNPMALVECLLGAANERVVRRLLILGWWHHPLSGPEPFSQVRKNSTAEWLYVDGQDGLKLLFEAFTVEYERLPLSLDELSASIQSILADTVETEEAWNQDWTRVNAALGHLREDAPEGVDNPPGGSMLSAWVEIEKCCGSDARRLEEEHESASISRLLRYQWVVDHYYLATAREPVPGPRTFLMIEDNLGPVNGGLHKDLLLLAEATGDRFFVTLGFEACSQVHDWLTMQRGKEDPALRREWFDLIGSPPAESPQDHSFAIVDTAPVLTVGSVRIDAILVDLLLRGGTRGGLDGEGIVQHFSDRFPGVPVFVVTRSEEPDILARCVKVRGADRVIPKRRILQLPYAFRDYLYREVSPLLPEMRSAGLDSAMIRLYRTWTRDPDILWNGDKTFHGVEHRFVHHINLWRMANAILARVWPQVMEHAARLIDGHLLRSPQEALFCFFGSIWLHDIGLKGNGKYQTADEVRHRHAFLSGELIRGHPAAYGLAGLDQRLIDAIAALSQYHQSNCPLESLDECVGKPTEGLFESPLATYQPGLLPWEALLRLLDGAEHHRKRVGSPQLSASKLVTLEHDRLYHKAKGEQGRLDSRDYAKWLANQPEHLDKHLAVLDVQVSVEWEKESGTWNLFLWYAFEEGMESVYRGKIALYVLQEWWETGRYLRQLGLAVPERPPGLRQTHTTWTYYPVWDAPEIKRRFQEIEKEKQRSHRIIEQQQAENNTAWRMFEDDELRRWLKMPDR